MENKKFSIMDVFSVATQHVLSAKGIKQNAIAKDINVGVTTLNNYIKGKREGDETTRRKIAERLDWDYEKLLAFGQWIMEGNSPDEFYLLSVDFTGEEPDKLNSENNSSFKASGANEDRTTYKDSQNVNNYIHLPMFASRLSGKHGSFQNADRVESHLMFHNKFLRKFGDPDQMALFEVIGNSMQPFLYSGDVVLVNLNQNNFDNIIDGKAYAFREDHTVKVKRLSFQGANLIAISENSQLYPPYTVDTGNCSLIGEVLWVGREVC